VIVDLLFLLAVAVMWLVIAYQLALALAGSWLWRRTRGRDPLPANEDLDWPTLSVLIPAHNEESVIERTLSSLLAQTYPADRLEILVISDASTDRTAELVATCGRKHPSVRLLEIPPGQGGRGKSAALNTGMRHVDGELVAIYDADNTPEPDALKILVRELLLDRTLGAALGMFRTINRDRNLLTRFVNLETIAFQWIVQAGRWCLGRVSTLPGTNYVIRREILERLGGWDEQAIAEDSELSLRVYELGKFIKFVPSAVTWEQEPETLGVWLRQRTRWARGNNYVVAKFLRRRPRFQSKLIAFELVAFLALFYVFFAAIIVSDVLFVLCVTGLATANLAGPFNVVFVAAIGLFLLQLAHVASFEGERVPAVLLTGILMYFTYCQLWIVVVIRALYEDHVLRREHVWDKTPRFPSPRTGELLPQAAPQRKESP